MPKLKPLAEHQAAQRRDGDSEVLVPTGAACTELRCAPCGRKHRQSEMQGYNDKDEDGTPLGLDLEEHAHTEPCPGEMMIIRVDGKDAEHYARGREGEPGALRSGLKMARCSEEDCGWTGWA